MASLNKHPEWYWWPQNHRMARILGRVNLPAGVTLAFPCVNTVPQLGKLRWPRLRDFLDAMLSNRQRFVCVSRWFARADRGY